MQMFLFWLMAIQKQVRMCRVTRRSSAVYLALNPQRGQSPSAVRRSRSGNGFYRFHRALVWQIKRRPCGREAALEQQETTSLRFKTVPNERRGSHSVRAKKCVETPMLAKETKIAAKKVTRYFAGWCERFGQQSVLAREATLARFVWCIMSGFFNQMYNKHCTGTTCIRVGKLDFQLLFWPVKRQ